MANFVKHTELSICFIKLTLKIINTSFEKYLLHERLFASLLPFLKWRVQILRKNTFYSNFSIDVPISFVNVRFIFGGAMGLYGSVQGVWTRIIESKCDTMPICECNLFSARIRNVIIQYHAERGDNVSESIGLTKVFGPGEMKEEWIRDNYTNRSFTT
jgi:hypothetical protein